MSTTAKDMATAAPPSYEEAMYSSTSPPPRVGIIYPNTNVNVNIATAPPAPTHMHQPGFVPSYGSFETTAVNEIIIIGGCPACRIGMLEDSYTCLGMFCAIAFFPLGVLCCLAMKAKRCTNCNTEF